MIHLDLDDKERQILCETLRSYLSDLRYEIADTDSLDFRERLKDRKAVLEKINAALEEGA
jgi:hypothetical protein